MNQFAHSAHSLQLNSHPPPNLLIKPLHALPILCSSTNPPLNTTLKYETLDRGILAVLEIIRKPIRRSGAPTSGGAYHPSVPHIITRTILGPDTWTRKTEDIPQYQRIYLTPPAERSEYTVGRDGYRLCAGRFRDPRIVPPCSPQYSVCIIFRDGGTGEDVPRGHCVGGQPTHSPCQAPCPHASIAGPPRG